MTQLLEDFTEFITAAPTSWHAAVEMGNRLASCDYIPLEYEKKWELEKGKKYFVIREGSLAAFSLPKKKPEKMAIAAAHTDSPALKLKPHCVSKKKNMKLLGVEVYGGVVLPTFLGRDLVITGRVIVEKKKGKLEEHLVYLDDAPVIIPLIAPHLDREIYKKGLVLNKHDHLFSVATLEDEELDEDYLETLLQRQFAFENLIDFDLFLVPLDGPRFLGKDGEMLASYRLDNLSSAHSILVGLGYLDKPAEKTLSIGMFWDHEEIGSSTSVGAHSPFFSDVLARILPHYKLTPEEEVILRGNSLCLSVDMTHALNPNFESKYDKEHSPLLGKGLVLKYNANMRYVTNAKSGSHVQSLCNRLKLPTQKFANRADNAPGSTVGPIFSTQLGIETADIGIPQLAMHSAREVISSQDHLDMCTLLTSFLGEP